MQEEIGQTFYIPQVANIEFDGLSEVCPMIIEQKMFLLPLESPVYKQTAGSQPQSQLQGSSSLRQSLNEAPKLPISEITRDIHCGLPHNYDNTGSIANDRLSFGSMKADPENDKQALTFEDVITRNEGSEFQDEECEAIRISIERLQLPESMVVETKEPSMDDTNAPHEEFLAPAMVTETEDEVAPSGKVCEKRREKKESWSRAHVRAISAQESEKKCCNCAKSGCLKLYCECFAAGQYCEGCNCEGCHNTKEHEAERVTALKRIEKKNPSGYVRRMATCNNWSANKRQNSGTGCSCSKSGCRKGYCECFKAGTICGPSCSCVGCRNVKRKARRVKKKSM